VLRWASRRKHSNLRSDRKLSDGLWALSAGGAQEQQGTNQTTYVRTKAHDKPQTSAQWITAT
jgi:hypothetical protein